jgi:hypothetical protein
LLRSNQSAIANLQFAIGAASSVPQIANCLLQIKDMPQPDPGPAGEADAAGQPEAASLLTTTFF